MSWALRIPTPAPASPRAPGVGRYARCYHANYGAELRARRAGDAVALAETEWPEEVVITEENDS